MTTRRDTLKYIMGAGCLLAAPLVGAASEYAQKKLPERTIPKSGETLPIIGLGNSNAFREGDLPASTALISLLHEWGGAYVDCSGSSRFVVADVANRLGIGGDLFLGTYFMDTDEAAMRDNIRRLLQLTGKQQLDLVQAYPEFAVPNWAMFRRWKEEGLTRHIGIARHHSSYYDAMIDLMETGTVDILQVNYSPLETEADQKVLPAAADNGVGVTINRPFINGAYFDRVRGHDLPGWAAEFNCQSWAQFSLKFILAHPAVTCVLTETANLRHAEDNLGAGFGRLPDEGMRQRIVEHLRSL
jgi:diketogulonate reductase-like aldo/keto reductase